MLGAKAKEKHSRGGLGKFHLTRGPIASANAAAWKGGEGGRQSKSLVLDGLTSLAASLPSRPY